MRFLLAFACALLAGLGVGGGGLFVLFLTLMEGLPQLTAQGVNLLFFLFSSAASLFVHAGRRRIPWLWVLWISLGGITGALFGSRLALALTGSVLRRLFGGFLIFSGLYSLWGLLGKKKDKNLQKSKNISSKTLYKTK